MLPPRSDLMWHKVFQAFAKALASRPRAESVNAASEAVCDAFAHAAKTALPECNGAQPRRPWVRAATLELIDLRATARADQDVSLEKDLVRRIRASVRSDRRAWLDEVLTQKDWAQVRNTEEKRSDHTIGRPKDSTGRLVSSAVRAETMAEHLEKVQWAVRPASVASVRPPLGEELPVDLGPFAKQELVTATRAMKHGRASGMDGVPAEFWQAVVIDGPGCKWALEFCDIIWDRKEIPDDWRTARVATLHEKGDPALCDNYRPISFLAVGYKLFVAMLLRRLKRAGAEQRVWSTQWLQVRHRNRRCVLHGETHPRGSVGREGRVRSAVGIGLGKGLRFHTSGCVAHCAPTFRRARAFLTHGAKHLQEQNVPCAGRGRPIAFAPAARRRVPGMPTLAVSLRYRHDGAHP